MPMIAHRRYTFETQMCVTLTSTVSLPPLARLHQRRETRRMTLTEKQRKEIQANWVAPAGSEEEKQFLDAILHHGNLSAEERKYVQDWRDGKGDYGMHNHVFWELGKPRALGSVAHARAMERQAKLRGNTWFVAYYISAGKAEKEIVDKLGFASRNSLRGPKDTIANLVRQEYGYGDDPVPEEMITRWFLGM